MACSSETGGLPVSLGLLAIAPGTSLMPRMGMTGGCGLVGGVDDAWGAPRCRFIRAWTSRSSGGVILFPLWGPGDQSSAAVPMMALATAQCGPSTVRCQI